MTVEVRRNHRLLDRMPSHREARLRLHAVAGAPSARSRGREDLEQALGR